MPKNKHSARNHVRLGFVPLADSAPLIMASRLGFFEQHGLDVELSREVGWATLRDRLIHGELDAAQAPAGLVMAVSCGFGSPLVDCLTGLVLNLHGNAITLSQALWKRGVRDGCTLREHVAKSRRPLMLGVVHSCSSHSFLLRGWLKASGIDPDNDVQIVVVPPPQMPSAMEAGYLDGYCAGEPWNSHAVQSRIGWCAAASAKLAPGHPEKVLMVTRDFAERSEETHLRLIAALLEACRWCDEPENRDEMLQVLAQPKHVGASVAALRASLSGDFAFGNGRTERLPDFHIFHRGNANEPTIERARWVIRQLHTTGIADAKAVPYERAGDWFRADIFRQAQAFIETAATA